MTKKHNIIKRVTYGLCALAIALFSVLFCGTQTGIATNNAQANALSVSTPINGYYTVDFGSFNVFTIVKQPNLSGYNTWTSGALPVNFNLRFNSVYPNYVDGVDQTSFRTNMSLTYKILNQGRSAVLTENKLLNDDSFMLLPRVTEDEFTGEDGYTFQTPTAQNPTKQGWNNVYGWTTSDSLYRIQSNYLPYFFQLYDTWTEYNASFDFRNQVAISFYHCLVVTNDTQLGFDFTKVNSYRHTSLSSGNNRFQYSISEVEGDGIGAYQTIYFNNYDIYDFTYNNYETYYRLVIPNYNYNNITTQNIYYFDTMSYDNGYSLGYNTGLQESKKEAYEEGYNSGYLTGKSVGYEEGINTQENGFFNLMSAVVNAPVSVFTGMLDLNILGVNLSDFAIAILSIALVVAVLRFIL